MGPAPVLLAILLIAALLAGILFVVFRQIKPIPPLPQPLSASTPSEPHCGQCGYIVQGIESLRCPECGSDLRTVGIDVGRRGGRVSSPWAALAMTFGFSCGWTLLVFGIGSWVDLQSRNFVGYSRSITYNVTFTKPASGAYLQVAIQGSGSRRVDEDQRLNRSGATATDVPDVTLTLTGNDGPQGTLSADLSADTYTYTLKDGSASPPQKGFGPSAVARWIASSTGTSSPAVNAEATEIALIATTPPRGQQNVAASGRRGDSSSGASSSSSTGMDSGNWSRSGLANFTSGAGSYQIRDTPAKWRPIGLGVGGVVVWLLGVWWIQRRFWPRQRPQSKA